MSKLRLNKQGFLALLLAGTITISGLVALLQKNDSPEVTIENGIGYTNINPIKNWNVHPEDFVVLDIGDHNSVKTHFQDKKMKMCNEQDISLGVIISSDASDEASIYDDVEYVKSIVRDYDVDFPVYLNIDSIVTNDDLNNEMKTKLIKDFLEKCSANNIYVGIHGTDTNLCRVKQYCDITGYDALVVKEKETIDYDGPYNVYQELDGTLVAKENIAEVISKKDLNDSKGFASDGSYTISSESELTDVALRYGMSVNEILEFNGMKKKDIVENTVLRIPSLIDTTVPKGDVTYEQLSTPIRGCDMSYAQGTDISWEVMPDYFDFLILRSNIGLTEDDCFATNAKQAALANIPMGAYCYNTFSSDDFDSSEEFVKKQEQQADYTISVLKNKKVEFPVYLDVEGKVDSTTYKKEDVQAMLDVWVNKMTTSGYIPGLYCNQSTFRYLQSCVDYDLSERLEIWVAGGEKYSSTEGDCTKHTHVDIENVSANEVMDSLSVKAPIVQYTNIAKVTTTENGEETVVAGDSRDHLDINYSTVDYSSQEYTSDAKTTFDIKEFDGLDRIDGELWLYGLLGAGALVGGTVIAANIIGAKKRKQTPKVKSKR